MNGPSIVRRPSCCERETGWPDESKASLTRCRNDGATDPDWPWANNRPSGWLNPVKVSADAEDLLENIPSIIVTSLSSHTNE